MVSAAFIHSFFITNKTEHLFMFIGNLNFLFGEAATLGLFPFFVTDFFLLVGGRSFPGCHLCVLDSGDFMHSRYFLFTRGFTLLTAPQDN